MRAFTFSGSSTTILATKRRLCFYRKYRFLKIIPGMTNSPFLPHTGVAIRIIVISSCLGAKETVKSLKQAFKSLQNRLNGALNVDLANRQIYATDASIDQELAGLIQ